MAKKRIEAHLNMEHDLFDTASYDKLQNGSQILDQTKKKGKNDLDIFPELMEDTFYSLFKYNPKFKPPQNTNTIYQLNRNLLKEVVDNPDYTALRRKTKLKPIEAGVAAASMGEYLLNEHSNEIAELQEYLTKMKTNAKDLKKFLKEIKSVKTQLKRNPTPTQNRNLQNQLKMLNQKAQQQAQLIKQNQNQAQQVQNGLVKNGAVAAGIKQAKATTDIQSEFMAGWGSSTGIFKPVSYEERIKISQQIVHNPNLIKIAQLAGRFRWLAIKKQKEKTKHVMEEISDIKQSNEISRALPSECALLAMEETELLFLKKFANRELLTYDLSGMETKGKGPLIVCIDVSGSMRGERDVWCKATALALVEIAHRENRNAIVIPFDREVQTAFEFYKDNYSLSTVIEMATFFSGGGTDFDPPLTKALEYLENESKLEKGDIIIVTDGEGHLSDKVKMQVEEAKEKLRFSIFTVVIGQEFGYIQHSLKPLSDQLIPVEKLDQNIAGEIFESV